MPAPTPPSPARSGPAQALAKLGLTRPEALALHLPLRWEDETRLSHVARLLPGQTAQLDVTVAASRVAGQGLHRVLHLTVTDAAGDALMLRFLRHYPNQVKAWAVGRRLRVRGEVRGGLLGLEMVHPAVRLLTDGEPAPLPTTMTPVYPASAGLPQAYVRKAVDAGLARADLAEILPPQAVPTGLPTLREALAYLHHPPADAPLATLAERSHPAWQRLIFEELLAQQLSQWQARRERERRHAPALVARAGSAHDALLGTLPFALTAAQQRVADDISADLARTRPMHRLLQGDVGAGKTVVAALAALRAVDAGWQCALMAPTEILAEQHFGKLREWLAPLGLPVAWLTGSRKGRARAAQIEALASGNTLLAVGTQAVIQEGVRFARLGLAIVDEQHRFGVAQRLALRQGEGSFEPHLLMMSATPIPRTLAMTQLADVDVSTIDQLPPGRTPILTKVLSDARRPQVIERVRAQIDAGRQAYWVCPLIEESEKLDLQTAIATRADLCAALPGIQVGLLHGRLKAADKAAVMQAFAANHIQVLVATTVVEVGVDVPNASLMIIEHAERFGLAQLHQLRGRVGRGAAASACVLLHSPPLSSAGRERLRAMLETSDGFEIARRDLALRGPGEWLGTRQSGAGILRFAEPERDAGWLDQARATAVHLWQHHPAIARAQVTRWFGAELDWARA
ncbi:MAG: ATP-dependent DNA helicase RecG [Proteobacteria bacterium]|nr:ATP-dependent DNA helicase RecG [Pseudomonadota bacterium]